MKDRPFLGITLMVLATFVFAVQDGFSRHLAGEYNTMMVVMVRYWFFAAFVIVWAASRPGGLRATARTDRPVLQFGRGVLLAVEIIVAVKGFTLIGLVDSHAIFAAYPLMVMAMSGPMLGEVIGWRRWAAVAVGFVGVLIILSPGGEPRGWAHLIPVVSAIMFAFYTVLTRLASRTDSSKTSFFYTGIGGATVMTVMGLAYLEPMSRADQGWMLALCISGVLGHFLLIKALELAEASTLQPFTYLHLVFASVLGVLVFQEFLRLNTMVGAGLVIATGLFAIWRQAVASRSAHKAANAVHQAGIVREAQADR